MISSGQSVPSSGYGASGSRGLGDDYIGGTALLLCRSGDDAGDQATGINRNYSA